MVPFTAETIPQSMVALGANEKHRERVLVVDDEEPVARVLGRALGYAGYKVQIALNGHEAIHLLRNEPFDAMISDVRLPSLRGEVLERLARQHDPYLAIIMVTAARDISIAIECLRDGAYDYVTKPFDLADMVVRVGKALERRKLELKNLDYQMNLERRIAEQAEQLTRTMHGSLTALIYALEAKDAYTHNHSTRVATLATMLAVRFCCDENSFCRRVHVAALFHDIGKIGVPEAVLNKAGTLTKEEWAQVHLHPTIGETILRPLLEPEIVAIVRSHHEYFNGNGYPDGLQGENIPLGGRIVAVADAYDALTSPRPYREAITDECALDILREGAGSQWDSAVVEELLKLIGENKHSDIRQLRLLSRSESNISPSVDNLVGSFIFSNGIERHIGDNQAPHTGLSMPLKESEEGGRQAEVR